jgi:hypothetical protein
LHPLYLSSATHKSLKSRTSILKPWS